MNEAEANGALRRLRWRCRRGTRELDALLGSWLEEQGPSADAQTLAAFDALLEEPDPLIWDWLMGHAYPDRADWAVIIEQIRAKADL